MKLKINNFYKRKQLFVGIIVFVVISIIILSILLIILHNRNVDVDNVAVQDKKILQQKNVSGVADYALLDNSLEHTTQIVHREIEGSQKECIVVKIENLEDWNKIDENKQAEILKGLINTSRLQIDKEFGCVVIESQDKRVLEGYWQDTKGYVIIKR